MLLKDAWIILKTEYEISNRKKEAIMIRKWKLRYKCWKSWKVYSNAGKIQSVLILLGFQQDGLFNVMLHEQMKKEKQRH